MKLSGKFSPWCRHTLTLVVLLVLTGGISGRVQARDKLPPPVGELLPDEDCDNIAKEVYDKVLANPKKAEDIVAYAVEDHPKCASAIVKQGLDALAPKGGKADPLVVESVLSAVLGYLKGDPELMETVIQTVLEDYPQIKSDIPNILAGIYIDPLKTPVNPIPTPTPTPSPTPPATPVPVTPDQVM